MKKQFEINKKDGYIFETAIQDSEYNLNGRVIKLQKGDSVHVIVKKVNDEKQN